MKEEIKRSVSAIQPKLLAAIKELVAIESVRGHSTPGAPFGEGPKQALLKALELSEQLGFETVNHDNIIGYAQYGEQKTSEYYGIFGHVDVVAAGEGWFSPPYEATIRDHRLFGRGVLDNKGPILANLYSLYLLKELKVQFPMPVRIVFGTNEESGFACVKHYLTKEKPPVFGWTPDCKWPVVYGECGRLRVEVVADESKDENLFNWINAYCFSSISNGKSLGIDFKDQDFGAVKIRGYQLKKEAGQVKFGFSIVYPQACTSDEIVAQIQETLTASLQLKLLSNWDPVRSSAPSTYIDRIQDTFNQVTQLHLSPVTTTGGTYAKIIPNIVAYGPSYPGQKDIAHLPNEWMDLQDLEMNTLIYAQALYQLSTAMNKGESENG